jgi:RimJ/RimL family protein N-acetyltransferase
MKTSFKTERLVLRRPRMKDVDSIYENVNDKEVMKLLDSIPWPYKRNHAVQFIEKNKKEWGKTDFTFAIEMDGKVVGVMGLHNYNKKNRRAVLGYSLGKKYWGKGIMTEAVKALMKWAFKEANLMKVFAEIAIDNIGSWKVAKKVGMRRVGIVKKHYISKRNVWEDCYYYEIVRDDFKY